MYKVGTTVAITVAHDQKGKRDASRAFIPEAKAFEFYWRVQGSPVTLAYLDNRKPLPERRQQTVEAIQRGLAKSKQGVKHIALFGHGWRGGVQHGFRVRDAPALARVISEVASDDAPLVSLYCCSTAQGDAGGDGGFADTLRDALCHEGLDHCRIDAHSTRGHSTRNPHVRRFEGEGSPYGGQGGRYIVRPRGVLWGPWKRALRDREDPLRYEMTRLSVGDIHGLLGGIA